MRRVLVTGSRDWLDVARLEKVLWRLKEHFGPFILVHGGAKGADTQAALWAKANGCEVEERLADWNQYGKPAGHIRNAEMVKAGADVCLAFIRNESKGASGCAKLAIKADIRTIIFRDI